MVRVTYKHITTHCIYNKYALELVTHHFYMSLEVR